MQVNVLQYFEDGALRAFPDKTAIVDHGTEFTFADVERKAKCGAAAIVERLNCYNRPIAVYLPKSAGVIFADLAIAYSGNIYLNLDVKAPAQRTKNIIEHIEPVLIVTSKVLARDLAAIGVREEGVLAMDGLFEGENHPPADRDALWRGLERVIDTDPFCLINTSGSTGTPKGVALTHRGTIDFMDWCFERFQLCGQERIGSLSPFFFDIYTLELIFCLAKGATIVIIPDQLSIFPVKLVEFVAQQEISFIFWVPSIMVNISTLDLLDQFDLSKLRTIFFAGEVFPMKHLNRWRRTLRAAKFVNLYGPIEITVDCSYFVLDREFADHEVLPIGFPCRNTDILILNERDEVCQAGETGELCVRGSSLALGYWNDPDKTLKSFCQNPLNRRYPDLIYRTGDLVYRNELGELMLVGRKDFQIKHLGYRIELSEIEHQVLQIPGIANACVVYEKNNKEITLFYEAGAPNLTPTSIRQELSKIFPKYMLPAVFHPMTTLPRNPNGKIDRNGLMALCQPSGVI